VGSVYEKKKSTRASGPFVLSKSHNGVLKREPSKHHNQSQFEEGTGLHSFKQSRCIVSDSFITSDAQTFEPAAV
jgi:hypothetical protein